MLNILVSWFMRFFLMNITTFDMHNLLLQYVINSLSSIHSLKCFSTPLSLPVNFIKPHNMIIILNRWNKINISFCFYTFLFIIKQIMIFWQLLTCGRWHDENFNDVELRKITIFEKWKIFSGNVGKKEITPPKIVKLKKTVRNF